jgi:hypothetical protein
MTHLPIMIITTTFTLNEIQSEKLTRVYAHFYRQWSQSMKHYTRVDGKLVEVQVTGQAADLLFVRDRDTERRALVKPEKVIHVDRQGFETKEED